MTVLDYVFGQRFFHLDTFIDNGSDLDVGHGMYRLCFYSLFNNILPMWHWQSDYAVEWVSGFLGFV